ncbi:CGNR zinc finger domain-containing protein [Actinopolymorpha sp. B17G11]|uniref:CGNR zinc finger domain-containing protein n=1 Tax=Actinopolymorpha sp. B17G11 TaxID=3160861 RepID=UPI0032E44A31
MDFLRYAEQAADLVNSPLDDEDDLRAHLGERPWLADRVTGADVRALRRLQRQLRPAFEADSNHPEDVVRLLNELLARHPVSPFVSGHDAQSWHLHVAERESSVAETLAAEGLMGMAVVVCDLGADRFGRCQAKGCQNVFVDTSPNRSRRYCSERCSSRANVAAFRARRRSAAGADGSIADAAGPDASAGP